MEHEIEILSEQTSKMKLGFMKESDYENFRKTKIKVKNSDVEIGVCFYSNLLFVIVSSNGKMGSFWFGESDYDDILDLELCDVDVNCLIGNRKDESSQFFANNLINEVLKNLHIKGQDKYSKIKKVILSISLKYDTLLESELNQEEILYTKEFKELLTETKIKVDELIFN